MEILLFAVVGIVFCTALFLAWGYYRKWQLAKGWLTHGALILALFYFWMIVGSIGQGVIERRGLLPMDAANTLWALGPLILILILYIIGRQFLPQKKEEFCEK